jgi:hypothetical protein
MVHSLLQTGPGTSSLDFRDQGSVVGITISFVDSAPGALEVSFNSSPSPTVNDTTGLIAGVVLNGSGLSREATFHLREPVDVGERLFLHVSGVGNSGRALISTDAASQKPPPRRR